jgi:hypothetical protein
LIATSRPSCGSTRAIDLAHAAGTEQRDDLVSPQTEARLERGGGTRGSSCVANRKAGGSPNAPASGIGIEQPEDFVAAVRDRRRTTREQGCASCRRLVDDLSNRSAARAHRSGVMARRCADGVVAETRRVERAAMRARVAIRA